MATLNDIRSTFLDFFVKNDHVRVPSSSVVPKNDPTLMFTNAGMVQFKNVFTGQESRPYERATTSQKCVRAGGKHNDLDNVGYTARHHTFFEMLGNFSFGNYFKEQAITYAWELLTHDFGLPKDKLLVTVYHDDDDAANIWKKIAGFSDDKIIRIATDDNFWQMGPTGPCGPSSEIFYDHGDHIWGGPPGSPDEDGDRFIEIWNLVFMQFEQFDDSPREALPKPSIDTGMGLERVAAILQGKHDNYDTDLFRALIEASAEVSNIDADGPQNVHHRVIADHLRSASFLIADGILPSNEGRGYVLRRIMRRAMRHAHLLGAQDPVMYKLVPKLVQKMGQAFPELGQAQSLIEETLKLEETRFQTTLDRGLRLLDDEVNKLANGAPLSGDAAFKLYDTYGFPLDLTQDALRDRDIGVDVDGFQRSMAEQKTKARAAWAGSGETKQSPVWLDLDSRLESTEFLGYDSEQSEGVALALVHESNETQEINEGDSGILIVNQTPFYAEAGGQVGDTGKIRWDEGTAEVTDVKKIGGLFLHSVRVTSGNLSRNEPLVLTVDHDRRSKIRANHTATHLLNEALRTSLGGHIAQRGSLNDAERLRFDFTHTKPVTQKEINAIENEVSQIIRQNNLVSTRIMTPDDARGLGAQALFGEKYGDEVRVVSMGTRDGSGKGTDGKTYSIELCGGTHVRQLGEVGGFVITSESASASGVRRIEALTGHAAGAFLRQQGRHLSELAGVLHTRPNELVERVKSLLDERKSLQQEITELRKAVAMGGNTSNDQVSQINGMRFLGRILDGVSGKDLRGLIDEQKAKLGSGIVLFIANSGGKAAIAAGVTNDLIGRISAVDLVRIASEEMGGKGGGGRPDMAQGGAPNTDKSDNVIPAIEAFLHSK